MAGLDIPHNNWSPKWRPALAILDVFCIKGRQIFFWSPNCLGDHFYPPFLRVNPFLNCDKLHYVIYVKLHFRYLPLFTKPAWWRLNTVKNMFIHINFRSRLHFLFLFSSIKSKDGKHIIFHFYLYKCVATPEEDVLKFKP